MGGEAASAASVYPLVSWQQTTIRHQLYADVARAFLLYITSSLSIYNNRPDVKPNRTNNSDCERKGCNQLGSY